MNSKLQEKLDRNENSHKGENGKVGVIGGSKDYSGAPALAAQAALKTGCDLTKIVTSEKVSDIVDSYSENLIVRSYPSAYLNSSGVENCLETASWSDSLVVGPGMSKPDNKALTQLFSSYDGPMVVDADAIDTAARQKVSNTVLTPHQEEARIIRQKYGSIANFIQETKDTVVILKGSTDKIYSDEGVVEVDAGDPTMTVGGTGDLLAGVVGSLISQGLNLSEAAEIGARLNAEAGEIAAGELGNGATAKDIQDKLPSALSNL